MVDQLKYEGVKVTLAGETYVVPPLNFKALQIHEALIKDFWKFQQSIKDGVPQEKLLDLPFQGKYLPIVHAAIVRNYPDVTLQHLEDELQMEDYGEFSGALNAAFTVGTGKKTPGEAKAVAS
jgi:hypothetical protein